MPTRCPPVRTAPRREIPPRAGEPGLDSGGSGALARAATSDSPSPAMRSAAGARALGSHPERRGKPRRAPCWRPTSLVGGATGDAGASPAGYWAGNRLRGEKRNACRRWRDRAIFDRGAHPRKNPNPARRGAHVDSAPVTKTLSLLLVRLPEKGYRGRPKITRTSLPQEALSSILQPLDQAVGAARGDDRRKFVAARRQITDGPVEIDVDHPSAADQIVYVHDPAARLH
jgi:hypothetical protein